MFPRLKNGDATRALKKAGITPEPGKEIDLAMNRKERYEINPLKHTFRR